MTADARQPTAEEATRAFHDHLRMKAEDARLRLPDPASEVGLAALLADREIVRYPVEIRFGDPDLEPGEPAALIPLGERPSEGFRIALHEALRRDIAAAARFVAYQLVRVNWGEIASETEAEIFGAALFAEDVETYYGTLCRTADRLGG